MKKKKKKSFLRWRFQEVSHLFWSIIYILLLLPPCTLYSTSGWPYCASPYRYLLYGYIYIDSPHHIYISKHVCLCKNAPSSPSFLYIRNGEGGGAPDDDIYMYTKHRCARESECYRYIYIWYKKTILFILLILLLAAVLLQVLDKKKRRKDGRARAKKRGLHPFFLDGACVCVWWCAVVHTSASDLHTSICRWQYQIQKKI